MAYSDGTAAGIVLSGTAIRVAAAFLEDTDPSKFDFNGLIAGLFSAIIVGALQKADTRTGIGFAAIVFIGMVTYPTPNGQAPIAELTSKTFLGNSGSSAPSKRVPPNAV